jgi:hypothetical protein
MTTPRLLTTQERMQLPPSPATEALPQRFQAGTSGHILFAFPDGETPQIDTLAGRRVAGLSGRRAWPVTELSVGQGRRFTRLQNRERIHRRG